MSTPLLLQDNFENKVCDSNANKKPKITKSKSSYPGFNELLGRKVRGWVCEEIIGKGTFGVIYKCFKKLNEDNDKKTFGALKAEDQTKQSTHIVKEIRILEALRRTKRGCDFFAEVLEFGEKRKFKFVITTLFGMNLFDILIKMPNQRIAFRTWIRVAINVLQGLEILHSKKLIHMDLKPANIIVDYQCIKRHNEIIVRIIDFGLAKHLQYSNAEEIPISLEPTNPITKKDTPIWMGSIFHCSPHIHRGCEPSYRDDVFSWLYVTMDLYKELPWSPADTEANIAKKKINSNYNVYKDYFPSEVVSVINDVIENPSNKPPQYNTILTKLKICMDNNSITWGEECQWDAFFKPQNTTQKPINPTLKQTDVPDSEKKKLTDNNVPGPNISERTKK
uniref:non-specific serine/threonine protein kinase n=1 Tax=Strongyloides stercoralis TaxID=6248 RepID=A0A0K0DVV7_STRER